MKIRANHLTFVRLLALPLFCGLLYGDDNARWLALVLGTATGCTDFIDGYLARREGPTVLGALMDPVADKIFVIVASLPLTDLGWIPWWLVVAILLREYTVTALRSSFEVRGLRLPSSYLAKVKTWVQMIGIGLIVLARAHVAWVMFVVLIALTLGTVAALIIVARTQHRLHRGAVYGIFCFGGTLLLYWQGADTGLTLALFSLILAFTWISAMPYYINAASMFIGGGFRPFDATRILGATALPLLAVTTMVHTEAHTVPLIAVLVTEGAQAGLDNLLSHHQAAMSDARWTCRTLTIAVLLGLSLVSVFWASVLPWVAAAISLVETSLAFYGGRHIYLAPPERLATPQKSV